MLGRYKRLSHLSKLKVMIRLLLKYKMDSRLVRILMVMINCLHIILVVKYPITPVIL
ncbi:unnamed protein product [Trichobilharzia regenti]|nr:unnamed protein product [Trichobilharzia regenti]